MHSTPVHSLLRYLLVGFIILFLAFSGEALPTHAIHGTTKSLSSKRPVVVKNSLKSSHAKHVSANSCPVRAPKSRLHKRALAHPSGKEAMTLFHGTTTLGSAQAMAATDHGVDLAKTSRDGDLHHKKLEGGTCNGGLYLTDSLIAAAQFICYNKKKRNGVCP